MIELSQSCAIYTGCTPDDVPGFPITLDSPGAYRLTSVLEVLDANAHGIEVTSDYVSIDFNGFTLFGHNEVPISTHVCSLPGSGIGIFAPAAKGVVARNGRVRGMSSVGIYATGNETRIERMIAERNCGSAIAIGDDGSVIDSQVRANAGHGIYAGSGSRVRDSVAEQNSAYGIRADAGSVVTGCVASANGWSGIVVGGSGGGVVVASSVAGNGWNTSSSAGISVPAGAVATHNSAAGNSGVGISGNATAGVGQNTAAGNGGGSQSGAIIGCNALDGLPFCPP